MNAQENIKTEGKFTGFVIFAIVVVCVIVLLFIDYAVEEFLKGWYNPA